MGGRSKYIDTVPACINVSCSVCVCACVLCESQTSMNFGTVGHILKFKNGCYPNRKGSIEKR